MELKFYVGNTVFNDIEDYMNKEEFFEKTKEWISQDKSKWNLVTLMAYFCYKYNKNYGIQYKFARWKGDPGKTKEIRDISKIYKTLKESSQSWDSNISEKKNNILKTYNYINWIFDRKFRGKTKVNSTGLLVNHTLMNEFEKLYFAKLKQNREANKLKSLTEWIKKNLPSIDGEYSFSDLNDLNIFIKFFESNDFDDTDEEVALYKYIKERGLV